jgi:hypothetical protein
MTMLQKDCKKRVAAFKILLVLFAAFSACGALYAPICYTAPKVECIDLEEDVIVSHWGYDCLSQYTRTLEIGSLNRFDPLPVDRGQPTRFAPGRHAFVFTTTSPISDNLTWTLDRHTAVANANSPVCEPTAVEITWLEASSGDIAYVCLALLVTAWLILMGVKIRRFLCR